MFAESSYDAVVERYYVTQAKIKDLTSKRQAIDAKIECYQEEAIWLEETLDKFGKRTREHFEENTSSK